MARSIHTTRRTLLELSRQKFINAAQKQAALAEAATSLETKRRIKRMALGERQLHLPPPPSTTISTIPIDVLDESKYVHHGASAKDLQAILEALPESARLGVSRIQLSLGKADMEEHAHDSEGKRDPFTKRLGSELFSGVFCGPVLGRFKIKSGLVSVYAFVYDRDKLPLPRSLCDFYLRLHALKTFVHEMAHHHDHLARTSRGRWRADRRATVETYAEKMEHEWTRKVVLPYLQRVFPREAIALRKWVAHRGGLCVDLAFFAGDTRRTRRDGLESLVFTTSGAFENWVEDLPGCKSLEESRLAFAWELHYCDLYEQCLEILNSILAASPNQVPVLTCKADTLAHLERYDGALSTARRALEIEPANADVWETQGDVFACQHKWHELLGNCADWEQSGRLLRRARRELLIHRATAHCALENINEMESCVTAYLALFNSKTAETATRRKRVAMRRVFRWAGKPVPAEYSAKPK